MLDDNPLFPRPSAVPSTYASMAAFTAAANMYNSFYPSGSMPIDSASSFACSGKSSAKFMKNHQWSALELKRERLDPKVTVKLEDADLWKRFCAIGNEMIITKWVRKVYQLIERCPVRLEIGMDDDCFRIFVCPSVDSNRLQNMSFFSTLHPWMNIDTNIKNLSGSSQAKQSLIYMDGRTICRLCLVLFAHDEC